MRDNISPEGVWLKLFPKRAFASSLAETMLLSSSTTAIQPSELSRILFK